MKRACCTFAVTLDVLTPQPMQLLLDSAWFSAPQQTSDVSLKAVIASAARASRSALAIKPALSSFPCRRLESSKGCHHVFPQHAVLTQTSCMLRPLHCGLCIFCSSPDNCNRSSVERSSGAMSQDITSFWMNDGMGFQMFHILEYFRSLFSFA